ncbi:hypothetical protein LTR94_027363 [Friedmanniomyces endolithicus]|nr:hypothetical protein LTR94_027363 [Friedmanniomyces endolithicus]
MSEQQFNDCVTDKEAVAAMEGRVQAARAHGVSGTPAFYVNDTQVISPGGEGASLADLSTAIDAELANAAPAPGGLPAVTAADHVMGRADAPVTVVEYASLTCPHCAAWHDNVLPELKARYIDTGKVRFVYRTLPTQPAEVSGAAAGVAECAAPGKFFDTIDAFFAAQPSIRIVGPDLYFKRGRAASGRTDEELRTCLADDATQASIDAQIDGARAAGVRGTPSFFVNGQSVEDNSIQGLAAAIDPLLTR